MNAAIKVLTRAFKNIHYTPCVLTDARRKTQRKAMTRMHQLAFAVPCVSIMLASAAQSQTYEINWYTIDSGGEMFTSGGPFELSGTIGQHDAGTLTGGTFELAGGFWAVAFAASCPPDLNGDGFVNTQDFLLFLNRWAQGDPEADWNNDGTVNTLDFIAFLNEWVAGC